MIFYRVENKSPTRHKNSAKSKSVYTLWPNHTKINIKCRKEQFLNDIKRLKIFVQNNTFDDREV